MSEALTTTAGRQFVTFWVDGEMFGVPLAEVQEIIRMPGVVHVPMAPSSLEGIANLRGAVLPVTSLRRLFGMTEAEHNDATRVVVLNRGALSGFVVDRMASVISPEGDEIEPAEAIGSAVSSDLLQGMIKRDQRMIMLLDPASLGVRGALQTERRQTGGAAATEVAQGTATAAVTRTDRELQLVSFEVAGQEYAFPIADVQEIVQVPPRISMVPRSDVHVIGVMTLRNRLLPLVSLRSMFGMPQPALAEHNRIVVVSVGRNRGGEEIASVGIVMDAVKEVLRVSLSLVDAVPPLLSRSGHAADLESICRLEDGRRLVTILSAQKMFAGADFSGIAAEAATVQAEGDGRVAQAETEAVDEEEQFVVFRLSNEEYGVPIGAVQEIVRVPDELTRVPRTPDFMEGVVNLRGVVLPVVDQRRRFALPDMARNDRQRIMVLMVGHARTGFIVDSVVEVLKVPRSTIGPAPHLSEQQRLLIDRVANLERQKRMLLLLQPERLLSVDEQRSVEAL
ncbi:Positive regulator of CheA protein activity (CheW) [Rhodovastum atsumiense]|uniref:Chemotaxis protein CheW n=1 Tax=Rhodovastum atsumiense TaxID=504468 RepID=A0A5M6IQ97_9PROT|nr:chemotaxis protein CheW [Rhodovastum atsumiense]KAA5610099.1 chemotaxis protein CheW [Rhodovastum atsumiense]CAH2601429.1 Positive regulator of CheA protein activity (CheW) [Rhodovastum atsumiense]